jgi:hypothetical protein
MGQKLSSKKLPDLLSEADDEKDSDSFQTASVNLSKDLIYFSVMSETINPTTYLGFEIPIKFYSSPESVTEESTVCLEPKLSVIESIEATDETIQSIKVASPKRLTYI